MPAAKISTTLIRCLVSGLVPLWIAGTALAAEEPLPSAVKSRLTQIASMLDQADKSLAAGQLTSAQRKVNDANKALAEVQKRHAGKFSPDHPEYKAIVDRLEATTQKVQEATQAAANAADSAAKAKADNDALCQAWVEKLGPFVDYKNELYLRIGAELNNASEEDQARSRAAYAKAKVLVAEFQEVKFPLGKTMELQNVESALNSAMKYYGQMEEAARKEESCASWVARLRPFVDVGAGGDKLLIASPTVDAGQLRTQQAIYEEAKAAFAEYRTAEFPLGKTWQMEQLEKDLAERLDEFPKALAESMAMMSGDLGKRLDAILSYLDRDKAWQTDLSVKPPIVMERDLAALREEVQRVASTGAEDEAKLAELKAKLAKIEQTDASHRATRAERTFQLPGRFGGPELEALTAKAEEVIRAEYKDAEVLRTTVPSKEWAVESVIEATDSTGTALRHRITRSVRAQVAIQRSDGRVYLQGVYLDQDRQPEGWGPLKGHTTWSDWMSENNVGKEGPQQSGAD